MVTHKSQETEECLTLASLFLRIRTAETISYVLVVNIKMHPCWNQWEMCNSQNAFGFKKRRM